MSAGRGGRFANRPCGPCIGLKPAIIPILFSAALCTLGASAVLAAAPEAGAAAVVAVHLVARTGDGDVDAATAQVRVAHRLDDALRVRARPLDEGEAVVDVD